MEFFGEWVTTSLLPLNITLAFRRIFFFLKTKTTLFQLVSGHLQLGLLDKVLYSSHQHFSEIKLVCNIEVVVHIIEYCTER